LQAYFDLDSVLGTHIRTAGRLRATQAPQCAAGNAMSLDDDDDLDEGFFGAIDAIVQSHNATKQVRALLPAAQPLRTSIKRLDRAFTAPTCFVDAAHLTSSQPAAR
jgi:hypothetical protein